MRFNDGKVSPQGTFVIGRMHSKWREGNKGAVYALVKKEEKKEEEGEEEEGGSSSTCWALEKVLSSEEVGMGNGMAWVKNNDDDDDKKWYFYIVDSAAKTVQRFSADPKTGIPLTGTGEIVLDASDFDDKVPDGCDVDSDGNLWVALAETGTVVCFDPTAKEKGLPLSRKGTLRLPLTRVTSCAFGAAGSGGSGSGNGGEGSSEEEEVLFVTSREESKLAASGEASPVAGAVLFVPDVAAAARIGGSGGDKKKIRGGCAPGFVQL